MIMNNDKDSSDTIWVQKSQASVMGYESDELLNRTMSQKPESARKEDVIYWLLFSICMILHIKCTSHYRPVYDDDNGSYIFFSLLKETAHMAVIWCMSLVKPKRETSCYGVNIWWFMESGRRKGFRNQIVIDMEPNLVSMVILGHSAVMWSILKLRIYPES